MTKVSVSLSDADISYLDAQTLAGRYGSRSAALQDAIRKLRESELADAYAEAFAEWHDDVWDDALGDGLTA
ncbi:antitoxin [Homoserinibacter sp. GY 40078]|nr:antitoxin [Homoserinibacter sp. GY 40078]